MQLTNTTQELRGDLIINKNYPVQYIAGIKVIEFVNLPALTPALLQVSGLREFPSLSEVCIYNCLQFSRDKVHLLIPTIRAAIEKAHGVSKDDGGNGIIVDWSICRPAQDGSFLNESDIFKAWLCFLYRGAKKLRDVSVATDMNPVCLVELAQDCAATDGVSEIAAAYDLSCIWLWKSFASPLMRDHTDCPTQIQVLQRRLWSLCARYCRDEPFRTTMEHLSFWHDLLQLRYETTLVSPDDVAMQAIEDAAINIDGLKRTQTRTFDDLSPRTKCHTCKHESLPVVFFSKANVRDFKKGRDKIFTCRGCVYDQDVADFTKRQFAIAGTLQKLEKYLWAPGINSIQEIANEVVQITPVEKSGKKAKIPNNVSAVKGLFPNAMPDKFMSGVFANPVPAGLLTSFGNDSKQFDDPDLSTLLPEFLRMCPHKLDSQDCILGSQCRVGVPFVSLLPINPFPN